MLGVLIEALQGSQSVRVLTKKLQIIHSFSRILFKPTSCNLVKLVLSLILVAHGFVDGIKIKPKHSRLYLRDQIF